MYTNATCHQNHSKSGPSEYLSSITSTQNNRIIGHGFIWRRHLNKLRWFCLASVFSMLVLLPFLHLYQTYLAANAYELLAPGEKAVFDTMQSLTSPFTEAPKTQLDNFKGTTWTGTLFGVNVSDPLAVVTNSVASWSLNWGFIATALIPLIVSLLLGRVFCGWICPATFIYELNDNLGTWMQRIWFHKLGLPVGRLRFDLRLKYLVLAFFIMLTVPMGAVLISSIYPPAVVGREIYYAVVAGGFGIGSLFFLLTILFDLLIARRGFCRYLCPGGALYSLLGRYRLLRIQRDVSNCNDCAKCNAACQFGLDPMRDNFGQECNNCSACMASCPTDTLTFVSSIKDLQYQGPGHLSNQFKRQTQET